MTCPSDAALTEQDAARLQEIRDAVASMWNTVGCPGHASRLAQLPQMAPAAMRDLLRLLDARSHDAEFVTRATFDSVADALNTCIGKRVAAETALVAAHGLLARAEAAEQKLADVMADFNRLHDAPCHHCGAKP